jgi:D,D-heptose 1,7-bisphosphate phosphatase
MEFNGKPAVFLDRDGTLIAEREYLHRPDQVEIFPEAIEGLEKLRDAGFSLILVTNQSGVGRGYFTLADVEKVHDHINAILGARGIRFEAIYVAPEAPDQPSRGRKPSPQFLFDARDALGIDLTRSYMIGDKLIDLECGWNAKVAQSILVRTGYGAKVEKTSPEKIRSAVVVDSLLQGVGWILENSRTS